MKIPMDLERGRLCRSILLLSDLILKLKNLEETYRKLILLMEETLYKKK